MSKLAVARDGPKIETRLGGTNAETNAAEIGELRRRNHHLEHQVRKLERQNRRLSGALERLGNAQPPSAPNDSQLEGLRRVSGALSHLFNNLMTGIGCSSDLLRPKLPVTSEGHEILDVVDHAWQRGAEICQRLMMAAGEAPYAAAELDLNEVVRRAARKSFGDRRRVRLDLTGEALPLAGDAALLEKLVSELVVNAAEAIGDGDSRIVVSTGRQEHDWRRAGSRPRLAEPWVYLEVSDDGRGIAPDDVGRIFDPFFSTKFLGRGLGLTIVSSVAVQHGGAIQIQSQEDRGSTFRVLLPALAKPPSRRPRIT